MRLGFPDVTYPEPADIARRVGDIVTKLEELPGVAAVAASPFIPLLGGTRVATVTETGSLQQAPGDEVRIRYAPVTAGFFSTIGVAPTVGRNFERSDAMQRSGVAIVNAAMAARVWPNGDAVGRQFQIGDAVGFGVFRVVGIVPNFNHEGVVSERQAVPAAYVPLPYGMDRNVGVMVRAVGDPAEVVPRVRDVIRQLDPDVPMTAVRTMVRVQQDESWAFSFMASVFTVLGGIALGLAAVGVFGVVAYTVSQRTAEVGIRMAVGAQGSDVVRMFLRQGAVLCGGGVLVGLGLSLLAGPILQRALYQVSARDPVTLASIAVGLVAIGLLASYVPARRAARVDPMRTLRAM
jgi:putative ABC transport system permease protein